MLSKSEKNYKESNSGFYVMSVMSSQYNNIEIYEINLFYSSSAFISVRL